MLLLLFSCSAVFSSLQPHEPEPQQGPHRLLFSWDSPGKNWELGGPGRDLGGRRAQSLGDGPARNWGVPDPDGVGAGPAGPAYRMPALWKHHVSRGGGRGLHPGCAPRLGLLGF